MGTWMRACTNIVEQSPQDWVKFGYAWAAFASYDGRQPSRSKGGTGRYRVAQSVSAYVTNDVDRVQSTAVPVFVIDPMLQMIPVGGLYESGINIGEQLANDKECFVEDIGYHCWFALLHNQQVEPCLGNHSKYIHCPTDDR